MAAAANCSRRLLCRPTPTTFSLPIRRPLLAATSHLSSTPSFFSSPPLSISATTATALFSTSASRPGPKASKTKVHIRSGKRAKASKKKKNQFVRSKPPAPGERKAFRKRIVLSNGNALDVPGLEELTAADLLGNGKGVSADAAPEDASVAITTAPGTGRVLALPNNVVDQLRAVEAFKATQCFPLFKRPSLLIRGETVDLAKRMRTAAEAKEALRLVLDGGRVSGKSILLLQAMTYGFMDNWVVIHVPEAQELTTACTEYVPVPNTDPVQWVQPVYAYKMLASIQAANGKILSKLKTSRAYDNLTNPVPAGSSLMELAASAKEADQAWAVFQALFAELTDPSTERPPLLFSLDGLAHIMKTSDYRTPEFELIHSQDLLLVRLFTDLLSGATKLPHGGAVLAATCKGNSKANKSLDLALASRVAEQKTRAGVPTEAPAREPYYRGYDPRSEAVLQTVQVLEVNGVNKTEARALMEYWAASGLLRERVDEQAVAGVWTLGGNGLVGEMERSTLLNMR